MSNEKILVVDDDKNICELLRLYLVKEGYGVELRKIMSMAAPCPCTQCAGWV